MSVAAAGLSTVSSRTFLVEWTPPLGHDARAHALQWLGWQLEPERAAHLDPADADVLRRLLDPPTSTP